MTRFSSRKTTFAAQAASRQHCSVPGSSTGDILVEVEVESIDELKEALDAGAARILLDNFSLANLREAVSTNADYGYARAELEASGNVTLDTLRKIADTGVDYISTGALTKNIQCS